MSSKEAHNPSLSVQDSHTYTHTSQPKPGGCNYITLGSKGLLSTNRAEYAMSLDGNKPINNRPEKNAAATDKQIQCTKEGSFTANLWTN